MLPQLHNFTAYDHGLEDSQSIMSFALCAGISGVHLRRRGSHRLLFGSACSGAQLLAPVPYCLFIVGALTQWRPLNNILSIMEVDFADDD